MNAVPRIPLSRPSITDAEVALVTDAIQNGWGDRCYDYIHRFEQAFADHVGVRHAIATSSCTGALHMGMAALGIGPGDEVILADTNWVASVAPVMYLGAQPVLVDVLPDTWCLDPQAVRAAISPRTKAIIPVYLSGLPVDMDALYAIAKKHNLRVVEDAAQALGSSWQGERIGARGDFVSFSFQANKNITSSEGGCLVLNNEEEARLAEKYRLQGVTRTGFDGLDVDVLGGKFNMTDIAAAMGVEQLARLPQFVQRRQHLAARYQAQLAGLPLVQPRRSFSTKLGLTLPMSWHAAAKAASGGKRALWSPDG